MLFFFNPNAGFSLLGHFIGLFLIFLPRCWVIFFNPNAGFSFLGHFMGYFNAGLFFFYPTAGLSLSLVKLLNIAAAVSTGFLSLQERAVLSAAAYLVHSFGERFVYILFITSLMWCKLYYFTQRNIRTRCQSAAVISHWKHLCLA